ncbi:MAG: L-2-amino-thiazoline-4-carboxylic acid hydrolase [bacterium]|nr:L-2-amino-thiazoline-4-carboxylic acid hydrolase [bacterium]
MQIFLSIKYHADHRNRGLVEEIIATLGARGHRVVCVARDLEEWGGRRYSCRDLMARTVDLIQASDVVLVELSEKGVGLGIEAGYGHALGKPVFVVAVTGADVSDTLRGIARVVRFYHRTADLQDLLDGFSLPTGGQRGEVDAGFYYRDLLFRLLAALQQAGDDRALEVLAAIYHRQAADAAETRAGEMAARGEARDMEALHRFLFNPSDEERGFVYRTLRLDDDGVEVEVSRCPLALHLAQRGLPGATEPLFCAADIERVRAFNADMVLERPELLARGDQRCLFRFRWQAGGG